MSEDSLIRFDNLDALARARGWAPSDLAKASGKKLNQCSDMLRRQKSFGEKLARDLEQKLNLPRGWFDQIHDDDDPHLTNPFTPERVEPTVLSLHEPHVSDTRWLNAPLIDWARLGAELYRANHEWQAQNMRAFAASTPPKGDRFKMIEVPDDSLAPRICAGDLLAIDPDNTTPKRGQVVLIEGPDKEMMLRRFTPLPDNGFEVSDTKGATLDKTRHGLTLRGVAIGIIPHDL
jgi:SOS-response transcriptional repressor LexA